MPLQGYELSQNFHYVYLAFTVNSMFSIHFTDLHFEQFLVCNCWNVELL